MRLFTRRRRWSFTILLFATCLALHTTRADEADASISTPGELENENAGETNANDNTINNKVCLLDCVNGGKCRMGRTENSQQQQQQQQQQPTSVLDKKSADTSTTTKQGHYCFCPTGFVGIYCEIKFVLCSDESETCFNGKPCQRDLDDSGEEFFHCECDTNEAVSKLDSRDAGRFCEHSSMTTYCETDSDNSNDNQNTDKPFCANSGKCSSDGTTCTCPPQWTGEHCQDPLNLQSLYETEHYMDDDIQDAQQQQPTAAAPEKTRVAYVSLVIIIGTLIGAAIVLRHYGAEVQYGRIQLRQDELQQVPGQPQRRKRRPHPMEMEMKHVRSQQSNQRSSSNEIV
ncbi:hypothetical protein MPSEU_000999700 [Mayamaea pseudoterrestris]|nr:hypothetical protein MPSEU_000999700 [Mayamaea pseudoterrestris]